MATRTTTFQTNDELEASDLKSLCNPVGRTMTEWDWTLPD